MEAGGGKFEYVRRVLFYLAPIDPSVDVTEVGRTARVYSELTGRTDPTFTDVHLALLDLGATRGCVMLIYN